MESILGVLRSSPLVFLSLPLICPFGFRGFLCTSAFCHSSFLPFVSLRPFFSLPLDLSTSTSFRWTDYPRRLLSCLSNTGRQRCRFPSSLYCPSISTSFTCTLHLLYPRACMSQVPPFTLFFSFFSFSIFQSPHLIHTPFYRARMAGSIVVSTMAANGNYFRSNRLPCRSLVAYRLIFEPAIAGHVDLPYILIGSMNINVKIKGGSRNIPNY